MVSITNLQMATLSLMGSANQGSIDFSFLAPSTQGTTFNAGSVKVALANAEKNETKQLAQVAKDPAVKADLARYEKVVKNAKTIDDVLNDPIARKVLMTSAGLGQYSDNVALAKKALMSDPADTNSLAYKLQSTNSSWQQFATDFNLAKNGLDRLYDRQDGYAGTWTIQLQREGQPIEGTLQITKTTAPFSVDETTGEVTYSSTTYGAKIDGEIVPVTIDKDNKITLSVLWEDDLEHIHISKLTGTLGKDGMTAAGTQVDDGKDAGAWKAAPYYANSIQEVSANYIGEKRLDMLDSQVPGLGTAVLFKKNAGDFDTTLKILGSALGREVITTALALPKQLALQSLAAQTKAIEQRIPNPKKLANAAYADQIAQRYLIMLNGGLGGVTA
ncbi:MAG TPA: DUF1217 domain-containing protein [Hyphomonadaceae bacterium]|jgi:hypothetical protein|nr:DUF1217 domain-containing protein [Hyphomonadaceae bacterium]